MGDLLVAADKYDVDAKSICQKCSQKDSVVQYLVLANLHNAQVFYEAALNFVARNAEAVGSRKD